MMKYEYKIINMPPAGYLWRALEEVNKWGKQGYRLVTTPMTDGIYAVMERTYV